MTAALYWIRWALLVPAYLLAWRGAPWLVFVLLAPLHHDWRNDPVDLFLVYGLAGSFAPPVLCGIVAPGGKLIVSLTAAFLSALPGLFTLVIGPFVYHEFTQMQGGSKNAGLFNVLWLYGASFLLGAGLGFLSVYVAVFSRYRARLISEPTP